MEGTQLTENQRADLVPTHHQVDHTHPLPAIDLVPHQVTVIVTEEKTINTREIPKSLTRSEVDQEIKESALLIEETKFKGKQLTQQVIHIGLNKERSWG